MYRVNITKDQLKRLQEGDRDILVHLLKEQDEKIIEDLKKPTTTDNIAFLQGISYLTDSLLNKLKV